MWNRLMDWLPDLSLGDALQVLVGTVGLIVGGIGTWLAWKAIQMGREQDKFTQRQMEIIEEQKKLLEEQAKTQKRQVEIAEIQHRIELARAGREENMEVLAGPSYDGTIEICFRNKGVAQVRITRIRLITPPEVSVIVPTYDRDDVPPAFAQAMRRMYPSADVEVRDTIKNQLDDMGNTTQARVTELLWGYRGVMALVPGAPRSWHEMNVDETLVLRCAADPAVWPAMCTWELRTDYEEHTGRLKLSCGDEEL
jgi:hypothetical protein